MTTQELERYRNLIIYRRNKRRHLRRTLAWTVEDDAIECARAVLAMHYIRRAEARERIAPPAR